MKITTGYAVLVEYWNGSSYSVSRDAISVYLSREKAEEMAKAFTRYNPEYIVDVIEVEIE